MTCVLASSRPGYENIAKRLTNETGERFVYFTSNKDFEYKALKEEELFWLCQGDNGFSKVV